MSASISLNDADAARRWFTEVVEPLADSFVPANVERYVHLFAEVLARVDSSRRVEDLVSRYQRIRKTRAFSGPDPADVFVLSRVTLGADVAITSVLLDAAKQRFPRARIWFTGSRKGYELFEADPRIEHASVPYNRTGSVRERISASESLTELLDRPNSIVLDPDSRLTQLGLVPVCPEERYFFFESRGTDEPGSLSELASSWVEKILGVPDARAYMAPRRDSDDAYGVTISLGVGENPAKRVGDVFERRLMENLSASGRTILVDQGAGSEEAERVRRATAGLPNVQIFEGAFAAFAARIAASRAYVGYDSAGQHAAAACGVPLVTVFAGHTNDRFLQRWRPSGRGRIAVLDAHGADPIRLADDAVAALI